MESEITATVFMKIIVWVSIKTQITTEALFILIKENSKNWSTSVSYIQI